jgi:hypothetical protein
MPLNWADVSAWPTTNCDGSEPTKSVENLHTSPVSSTSVSSSRDHRRRPRPQVRSAIPASIRPNPRGHRPPSTSPPPTESRHEQSSWLRHSPPFINYADALGTLRKDGRKLHTTVAVATSEPREQRFERVTDPSSQPRTKRAAAAGDRCAGSAADAAAEGYRRRGRDRDRRFTGPVNSIIGRCLDVHLGRRRKSTRLWSHRTWDMPWNWLRRSDRAGCRQPPSPNCTSERVTRSSELLHAVAIGRYVVAC